MRASHDCETFAQVSNDSREIFVRASHDSRERILICFISRNEVSKWSYLCRIFVALCRSRKLPCNVFANVCEGLAKGS